MIRAKHNRFYVLFFDCLMRVWLHLAFRQIRIHGDIDDQGGSILLLSNHFSWWDGFIARYTNKKKLGRKLFVMMLEEQLRANIVLRKLGAFSIRKNSRSALESLNYAASILKNPRHLLLLFPQGRFQSIHTRPLSFEKGWVKLVQQAPNSMQLIFMACLTDYFAHRRPVLNVYLSKEPLDPFLELATPAEIAQKIEQRYNAFFSSCVACQNSKANQA